MNAATIHSAEVLAASGLAAYLLTLAFTPIVRAAGRRARILDHPDGHRKLHQLPIPRVGGVAIILAYALSLAFLFSPMSASLHLDRALFLPYLPAVAIVFLTGLLDDLLTLKPLQKLLGQTLAALLAVALGAHATGLPLLVSVFWLLLCTNAFNLIDGLDGLAAGTALIASATTVLVALLHGDSALAFAAAPLTAALIAFLRYNFPPATIFLGDCGSLTLGFLLGCFGLAWTRHAQSPLSLLAPAAALALPLADVVLSIVRRRLRGTPILAGDRGHIHHVVRARLRSKRAAVLALYSVCATASFFAILLSEATARYFAIIAILALIAAALFLSTLRYPEFTAAARTLRRRLSSTEVRDQLHLLELDQALAQADTPEALWQAALASARALRLASIRMTFQEHDFTATLHPHDPAWTLILPLGPGGALTLTASTRVDPSHLTLAVVQRIRLAVEQREQAWTPSEELSYSGAA